MTHPGEQHYPPGVTWDAPIARGTLPDLLADSAAKYGTRTAIEALNFEADHFVPGQGPDLDIAFLGTIALQQAGLPLDRIFATRASLVDQCGDAYFASASERKRRFHRTLVELGAIKLAPLPQENRGTA